MIARDDDEPQYTVDQLVGWFEYRLEEDTPGNYRAADLLPLGLTVAEIEEIGRRAAVAAGLEYASADISEPDSEGVFVVFTAEGSWTRWDRDLAELEAKRRRAGRVRAERARAWHADEDEWEDMLDECEGDS
jgi:hypothetical protein